MAPRSALPPSRCAAATSSPGPWPGPVSRGLLAFSLREALWLAGTQIGGDILVAYPCVDAAAVGELAGDDRARERIALVVDAPEQLALIGSAVRAVAPARRGPVRVWLDIDCSLRVGPAHLGARRSPLHTVSEVVRAARAVGRSVKPVGSGHSFSPVALTDGVLVDLSGMCGLAGVDRNVARASALGLPAALGESVSLVRVRAGTLLRHLNQMLAEQGLAMPNLGDIDAQTISGALATGTHGTGARFPGLAACVTAVQLVLADASIVECSRHVRPELFAAARLGIGAIGSSPRSNSPACRRFSCGRRSARSGWTRCWSGCRPGVRTPTTSICTSFRTPTGRS